MISSFCPGHISCIFRPVRTGNPMTTGSLGLGIRLDLGAKATMSKRDDTELHIFINGEEADAPVTRRAVTDMVPDVGLDVNIEHQLPIGQGFGTSASGTLAACLCIGDVFGFPEQLVYMSSHFAEISEGGGLGDVPAMLSPSHVPVRTVAGIAPKGRVEDSGLSFDELTLVVFEGGLETAPIINDPVMSSIIERAGDEALAIFNANPTSDNLFKASNYFSEKTGLESRKISDGLDLLRMKGRHAGMCMLGNSIFTDAPVDEAREIFEDAQIIGCSSYGGNVQVIRRG